MYTKFFGLREKPFSSSPDPAYFFSGESHRDALAHLVYAVNQDIGIVLLTGDHGSGKTIISRRLQSVLSHHVETVSILDTRLTPQELVTAICDQLGVSYDAAADAIPELLTGLDAHLLSLQAGGRSCVVLIDEAQQLSNDALLQLKAIRELEAGRPRCLHLVLMGESSLRKALTSSELAPLAEAVGSRYHLEPLQAEEIAPYVQHRLAVAGNPQQLFSDEALLLLHELTLGNPARINQVCDRALLAAFAEERRQVTPELVRWAARETTAPPRVTREIPRKTPLRGNRAVLPLLAVLACLAGAAGIWRTYSSAPLPPAQPSAKPTPQPTPPAPPPVLPDSLSPLSWPQHRDSTLSQQEAFKALFARWRLEWMPAEQDAPCDFARRQGLDCGLQQGNWSGLVTLNRPVVLELRAEGQTYWAALLKIEDAQAYVSIAGTMHQVPLLELERRWNGRFYLVRERE